MKQKLPGKLAGYFFAVYKGEDKKVPLEKDMQYSIAMFDQLTGKHKKSNVMLFVLDREQKQVVVVYDTFKDFFSNWDMIMSPELAREAADALTE